MSYDHAKYQFAVNMDCRIHDVINLGDPATILLRWHPSQDFEADLGSLTASPQAYAIDRHDGILLGPWTTATFNQALTDTVAGNADPEDQDPVLDQARNALVIASHALGWHESAVLNSHEFWLDLEKNVMTLDWHGYRLLRSGLGHAGTRHEPRYWVAPDAIRPPIGKVIQSSEPVDEHVSEIAIDAIVQAWDLYESHRDGNWEYMSMEAELMLWGVSVGRQTLDGIPSRDRQSMRIASSELTSALIEDLTDVIPNVAFDAWQLALLPGLTGRLKHERGSQK